MDKITADDDCVVIYEVTGSEFIIALSDSKFETDTIHITVDEKLTEDSLTQGVTSQIIGSTTKITFNVSQAKNYKVAFFRDTPSTDGITVDNTDPGFMQSGFSKTSSYIQAYIGTNYQHDGTPEADTSPQKLAKWTPNIPQEGYYKIYMSWPAHSTLRPDKAPLVIKHSAGTDYSKTVNQLDVQNNGTWREIGTYKLPQGTGNYVMIKGDCPGYTIADAVKF